MSSSQTIEIPARDLRPGDVVHFGDRRKTVAAVATQVAHFYNPGMGIPHGCLSLYWVGDEWSYPIGPAQRVTVTR